MIDFQGAGPYAVHHAFDVMRKCRKIVEPEHRAGSFDRVDRSEQTIDGILVFRVVLNVENALFDCH